MEAINWKVEGMSCSNCALTVGNYLKKEGLQNVKVNLIGGDISFDADTEIPKQNIIEGIESLGYHVQTGDGSITSTSKRFLRTHLQKFLFCLVFTLPLMLHMLDKWIHLHWLMNRWVQLVLCLPVYIVGMDFFGRSAIQSIRNKNRKVNWFWVNFKLLFNLIMTLIEP